MFIDILNEENFILYAAKHYDNPQCVDTNEFYDDIKRFKYLKRLFGKYIECGELRERLILNHLTVIYNIFGIHATRMLILKLDLYLPQLKPFLVLMGYLPDKVEHVGPDNITVHTSDIPMDTYIINVLRNI